MSTLLEKQIEHRVCDHAKSKGWLTYKFTSPARSAVPDRLMISPKGVCIFIEFKREGQKPTDAQAREHERLRKQGVQVFVVDTVEYGYSVIEAVEQ